MDLRKTIHRLLFIAIAAATLAACKTPGATSKEATIYGEDYYSGLGSNIERLKALLSGVFVQYSYETGSTKPAQLWTVNNEQDSVWLYAFPVGDVSRDGHWIYQRQMMSHAPDKPIYEAFTKLERVSRDTFLAEFYNPSEEHTWEEILKNPKDLNNVDFKSLEKTTEEITYVREGVASYKASSGRYVDHQKRSPYRADHYSIGPKEMTFYSVAYQEKIGGESENSKLKQILKRRLKSDLPFFDEKKKKN